MIKLEHPSKLSFNNVDILKNMFENSSIKIKFLNYNTFKDLNFFQTSLSNSIYNILFDTSFWIFYTFNKFSRKYFKMKECLVNLKNVLVFFDHFLIQNQKYYNLITIVLESMYSYLHQMYNYLYWCTIILLPIRKKHLNIQKNKLIFLYLYYTLKAYKFYNSIN